MSFLRDLFFDETKPSQAYKKNTYFEEFKEKEESYIYSIDVKI